MKTTYEVYKIENKKYVLIHATDDVEEAKQMCNQHNENLELSEDTWAYLSIHIHHKIQNNETSKES